MAVHAQAADRSGHSSVARQRIGAVPVARRLFCGEGRNLRQSRGSGAGNSPGRSRSRRVLAGRPHPLGTGRPTRALPRTDFARRDRHRDCGAGRLARGTPGVAGAHAFRRHSGPSFSRAATELGAVARLSTGSPGLGTAVAASAASLRVETTGRRRSQPMNWIHAMVAIVVVLGGVLTLCMYLIWIERKLSARIQDRIGPNRVGPYGLLQSIADGIKFVLKEDVIPADRGQGPVRHRADDLGLHHDVGLFGRAVRASRRRSQAGSRSRSPQTSTSASCSSLRSRAWRCTASSWGAGRRTTNTVLWAASVRAPKS